MMVFLLTCCKALDIEALGPVFLAMLPADRTITGACVVVLVSLFLMARTASASVLIGMGASMVTED